jgi:hypothetical protein
MDQELLGSGFFSNKEQVGPPIEQLEGVESIHWSGQSGGEGKEGKSKQNSQDEDDDNNRPSSAVLQGLKLNVSEPWERSLLRLLQEAKASSKTCSVSEDTTTANADRSRPVAELILLGHSESRDYALEIEGNDDNIITSILSRSSNTSPSRRQKQQHSIYRPTGADTEHALFDDHTYDDDDNDEIISKSDSGGGGGKTSHKGSAGTCNNCKYTTEQQQVEARGEQDASDRDNTSKSNNIIPRGTSIVTSGRKRSFPIRKARAVREEDDPVAVWLMDVHDKDHHHLPRRPPVPDLLLPLL